MEKSFHQQHNILGTHFPVSENWEVHKLFYLHLYFPKKELYWVDMKPLSKEVPSKQLLLSNKTFYSVCLKDSS